MNTNIQPLRAVEVASDVRVLDATTSIEPTQWEVVRTLDRKDGPIKRDSKWQGYMMKPANQDSEVPVLYTIGASELRKLGVQTKTKFFEVKGKGEKAVYTLVNTFFGVRKNPNANSAELYLDPK